MFIEINNTIQDTNKLERKRILAKKLLKQRIDAEIKALGLMKIGEEYYDEESLLIIDLRTINLEEYLEENFSF